MALYRLGAQAPQVAASAYVASEATLIGRVVLGEHASVWPGAVVRADNEAIRIGDASNVQEGAVLHADPGFPLLIGTGVTVGHQAMLHGCTIEDGTLIGIQAVVLNLAVIGRNCLVGATGLVTERKQVPAGSMLVGVPARVLRPLRPEEIDNMAQIAQSYVRRAVLFRAELERIG